MPRTSRRRPARTKSRSRRSERNAGPAAQWTRNFGFPTSWTTRIGDDDLSVTLEATRPMQAAVARVEINGKLAGRYDSLREAKEAAEAEAAAVPSEIVPAYDVDAPATMGAALLAGRSDVLVSQETIDYDEKWSPYQRAVFDFVRRGKGNAIVEAVAGSGKCVGAGTPVMLHSGRIVPVESVKVGDRLMGPDSEPREVLSTNVGHGPLWRITPVKGDPWVCNDVHVMTLAGTNRHLGEVIDIPLNEHIAKHGHRNRLDRDWKLMRVGVSFPRRDVPVDPYLLGLWIGDGTFGEPQITNCEPEIRAYCRDAAARYGAELIEREDADHATWNLRFRVGERGDAHRGTPSILRRFFRDECARGEAKIIPDDYIYNDEATRLALLAGIVDTDGFVEHGLLEITTVSETLRDQILFVARSLGLAAYSREKASSIKSIGFTGVYQRITISGDLDRIPCLVARRQADERRQIKRVSVTGFDAEPIGDGDYYGFTLDRDGRFLLGDFTVTHNTTTLMQALEYIPRDASVLILAFNSSIQLELQSRAPRNRHVTIKTLTGWGLSFLRRHWKTPMASQSEGNRRDDAVVEESIPSFRESGLPFQDDEDGNMGYDTLKRSASTLIGLCMSYMAVSDASITEVQRDFDLFVDDNGDPEGFVLYGPMGPDHSESNPAKWTHRDVLSWVKTAIGLQLKEPKDGGSISFRDMVFVPAMHPGWKAPELYDFVFVDETQDCDVAQLSLVMRAVKPRGRIIVIGDRNQCVAVDTMVTTPTGEVRADALSVGDLITVYLNGKNAEQTVQTLSPVREADCVRVRTASGRSLTMSLEHRIWSTATFVPKRGVTTVSLLAQHERGCTVTISGRGVNGDESTDFSRNCDAEAYARETALILGASLVNTIAVRGHDALELTNAASLLVGMEIAVKDGAAVRVEAIESIERCRASVIDIGAGTANNFYGNGILSHNSIYRFRGADTDAMPRLERELNATRLPLSVSYRVTQCAADEARKVVGDFDVPRNANGEPMATPGICNEISARKMAALWDAGDVVITRSTKIKGESGLLSKIALKVFVTGKIPYVMGDPDALPKVLRGAIKQITKYMKLGVDTIDAFRDATDEWVAQGQERFRLELIATRERQEKVLKRRYRGHRLDDGVEDFEEWKRFDEIRSCFFNSDGTGIAQQEGVTDLGSIETRIKQLSPTDDDLEKMTPERFKRIVAQCVTISTTHKIKGAEFPRVFVLESTFGYTRTGLQPRRKQKPKAAIEEKNLWYVAITRVKGERGNIERGIMPREGELYYVNDIEALVRGKTVKDLQEVMK